jgi:hypothetical protein
MLRLRQRKVAVFNWIEEEKYMNNRDGEDRNSLRQGDAYIHPVDTTSSSTRRMMSAHLYSDPTA